MNPRSLVFRLGAWYTLLLGATFLLVSAGAFFGLQHYLYANVRDSLKRRSAQVGQILAQLPVDAPISVLDREISDRIAPEVNRGFVYVSRDGAVIYRSGPPSDHSFDPAAVPAPPATPDSPSPTRIAREQHLMLGVTPVQAPSGRYIVEVGVTLARVEMVLEHLLHLLLLLLPALVACAAGGGYLLVSWALRPVDRLSQTAEQMSLQDLAQRLPVARSGDVLERLSNAFNNMLGRLRDSVQASRQFLADASHELRTPLTVIKGELHELVEAESLSSSEVRERVGSVLEEVARLEHLVSGLLALSRLDSGEIRRDWARVDLAELAANTAEQMRLLAEDRGIDIELSGLRKAEICGDRARLKQIIVNLLDNAIRFTPRGGKVALCTGAEEGGCVLELSDTGIGIPAAAIPRVFDRFYRVDEARSRDDGGAGLGLSIVKSICSLHGAEIRVDSAVAIGSKFRITFPLMN